MDTFVEFLNIEDEDSKKIFEYYLNFLGEFSNTNFPYDQQLKLKGASSKFLNSFNRTAYINPEKKEVYKKLFEEFQRELKLFRREQSFSRLQRLISASYRKNFRLFKLQDAFQELYSYTSELISEVANKYYYLDDLKVNDFFKPDNSNKTKIKELINEAIELIRTDMSLSEKSKSSLIEYLERTNRELDITKVNWTRFLGRIKETIIVLGALGSFIGGASVLSTAKEKLEQTTTIIQKSSVNVNFNIMNETFNIQNIHTISSMNEFLELPENKDIQNIDEISPDEIPNN